MTHLAETQAVAGATRDRGVLGALRSTANMGLALAAGAIGVALTLVVATFLALLTILASAFLALFSLAYRLRTPMRRADPSLIEARKIGHAWVAYGFDRPHP